ncbi:sensor histidine kinase [Micromonospora rubida]|uniref:sensor histidine kinase n=1 Tax=Micromonospora rubida TaxID=2697657 RepID=UPI002E295F42|nr:sensor histidine kinase [Micromonospora rubida]
MASPEPSVASAAAPHTAPAEPETVLAALSRPNFAFGRWLWRSLAYLLGTVPVVLAVGVPLGVLALPCAALAADGSGLERAGAALLAVALALACGPLLSAPVAMVERWRLRLVDARPVPRRPPAESPGRWLRSRYADPAAWRESADLALLVTVVPVLYTAVAVVLLLIGVLVAAPALVAGSDRPVSLGIGTASTVGQAIPYALVGLLAAPAAPWLVGLLAGGHGALTRALLAAGPDERLRAELVEVSRSRARLAAAFEAERRRIERDLHDGAQQRLVSLTLQLGLARLDLPPDSPAAHSVASAHRQAKELMVELRALIHDIRPQVLTDRGLATAVEELADRAGVPVTVDAALPARPPAHLEATAWFVVAEALTNVARHSDATRATVRLRRRGDALLVEVGDDGRGGAEPARGSGLTGLADRVAVADGRMFLSSPVGGPTLLSVELPWTPYEPPSG